MLEIIAVLTLTLMLGNSNVATPVYIQGNVAEFIIPTQTTESKMKEILAEGMKEYDKDILFPDLVETMTIYNYERLNNVHMQYDTKTKEITGVVVTGKDVVAFWNHFWETYANAFDEEDALYEIDKIKSLYEQKDVELEIVKRITQDALNYKGYQGVDTDKIIKAAQERYLTDCYGPDVLCLKDRVTF